MKKFYGSVTRRDMEDIMGTLELKLRYGLVDSIGPRCMKTQKDLFRLVRNAKGRGISRKRNAMPLNYNLQIDLFDVWGIDFMGPFVNSHGFEHILVMVDYVSKWVEAMPCRKASTEESIHMIKSVIFPRYGVPRILISDGGTHFTGKDFGKCLKKLGIEHRVLVQEFLV